MNQQMTNTSLAHETQITEPVDGNELVIGSGFEARSFKYNQFDSLMDPIVMVDHYTMTAPTFGEHPHAGMSAVSVLFEDSTGIFNNKDSLGNDIDLKPGDAYWLKAGSGAIHDEKPTSGSVTHGLQIFVNLPGKHKFDVPESVHIANSAIPIIDDKNYRVRVVFGETNGVLGAVSPVLALTILDVFIKSNGLFEHSVQQDQNLFIYAVDGDVEIQLDANCIQLKQHQATAIHSGSGDTRLTIASKDNSHVVVLQGKPIGERFVQKGPFVMSSSADLKRVVTAYESGTMPSINHNQPQTSVLMS